MWVWSLDQEDPVEEGMATHTSILAWRLPWAEEPGGVQSKGSQRLRQDWSDLYACMAVESCSSIRDGTWTLGSESANHWTIREFPLKHLLYLIRLPGLWTPSPSLHRRLTLGLGVKLCLLKLNVLIYYTFHGEIFAPSLPTYNNSSPRRLGKKKEKQVGSPAFLCATFSGLDEVTWCSVFLPPSSVSLF